MILQVMAAHDSKARAFITPFFVPHVDVGVRTFAIAANTPGHQVCAHPEDFTLWHLGTFDDQTATFELLRPAANLGMAVQFKTLGSPDVQSKIS